MRVIHVLSAVALLLLTIFHLTRGFTNHRVRNDNAEHLIPTFVLFGVFWAFVVFSGFFQIGSRGILPPALLWKLGATFAGGVLGLLTGYGYIRGQWPVFTYIVGQTVATLLFGVSMYWGIFVL